MKADLAAAALSVALLPGIGATCPDISAGLLLHSCRTPVAVDIVTLPEEAAALDDRAALVVTGGYTGVDTRDGDRPNPVGLFIDDGKVINPTLARMDGVLVVAPDSAQPSLYHRARLPGGTDLGDPAARMAWASAMAEAGASVLQSHLLIVDGVIDVREQDGAPRAVRRILFTDRDGFGVWQSPRALTLFEAANALAAAYDPVMALNLDMGSYDYCIRDGAACGVLGPGQTGRLSNVIRFGEGW